MFGSFLRLELLSCFRHSIEWLWFITVSSLSYSVESLVKKLLTVQLNRKKHDAAISASHFSVEYPNRIKVRTTRNLYSVVGDTGKGYSPINSNEVSCLLG